jgi:hypothetical protein
MADITFQDVIQVDALPEKIREFIRDPARIADYYPDLIDFGIFEAGKVFWCSGTAGVALFEIIEERCTETMVVMSILTSLSAQQPYTVEGIKADPFISMIEEWDVVPMDGGAQITKTWIDVELHQMKELPIADIIQETADLEREKIIKAWGETAA